MSFTLNDLITPVSRQDVEASIYDVLAALGVDVGIWKPGSVVRTMIVAFSLVLSSFSQLTAATARSGFLELSEGDWLTLVAHHVYGVDRITATFATGTIRLINSGGGVYSFDAGDVIVSTPDGVHFRNSSAFSLGASGSATATVTVSITAATAGKAGGAAAGAVTQLVTALSGVTCSNAFALVGLDAELDPALRLRCSEKLGSLSPMGPWDAYSFAARSATRVDGSSVGVTRVRILKDGFGGVFVHTASASGAVEPADLAVIDAAIKQRAVPEAVTAHTLAATEKSIPITYEAWTYGAADAQAQALIERRLADYMSSQPIGGNVIDPAPGKVFADAIRAAIASTQPEIFRVVLTLPSGDVELAASEVPTLGLVTCIAINKVPAADAA
jgi:phage-related baseplate assembly protein